MKERWFNYRPLCLIFGFLLLGTVFSFYLLKELAFTISITLTTALALVYWQYIKGSLNIFWFLLLLLLLE